MTKRAILEPADVWRVNSGPFKARRVELGLSLRSCATALSSHCTVGINYMKIQRCERLNYFEVDREMYEAIRKVLDI